MHKKNVLNSSIHVQEMKTCRSAEFFTEDTHPRHRIAMCCLKKKKVVVKTLHLQCICLILVVIIELQVLVLNVEYRRLKLRTVHKVFGYTCVRGCTCSITGTLKIVIAFRF